MRVLLGLCQGTIIGGRLCTAARATSTPKQALQRRRHRARIACTRYRYQGRPHCCLALYRLHSFCHVA